MMTPKASASGLVLRNLGNGYAVHARAGGKLLGHCINYNRGDWVIYSPTGIFQIGAGRTRAEALASAWPEKVPT